MNKKNSNIVKRVALALLSSIIAGEVLIMLVVDNLNIREFWIEAIIDSVLLTLIIIPAVFYIVVLPLRKQIVLRMAAEKALKSSEAHLRTLVQTIPDLIWLKDSNGVFITCNKQFEKYFGAKEAEIIGKTDYDFVDRELADYFRMNDKKAMEACGPSMNEEWITFADGGERILLETVKVPMTDDEGNMIGVLGIGRDITQRKLAEDEIKQKNEQLLMVQEDREKMFSIIVHDLKTPFNSFLGMTQLLSEELHSFTQEEIKEMAASMKTSAESLYALLENLLLWAKSKRGMIPFNPALIELLPVVREGAEMMEEPAKNKNITIEIDINEDIAVLADNNILQTIIRNLVSNAVKFTLPGGHVILKAKSKDNSSVEVSVEDTGIGMSHEIMDNLFKPGSRTGRKGTEGESSSGLGLIVCNDFVNMLGGKLEIESEQGKGSRFFFSLPSH
ncbi:MAG: PAS domain S-box protein [Bacteroidales bacterium]|nr:PAS domain S-box protein [Bacteroidales bacterium]